MPSNMVQFPNQGLLVWEHTCISEARGKWKMDCKDLKHVVHEEKLRSNAQMSHQFLSS